MFWHNWVFGRVVKASDLGSDVATRMSSILIALTNLLLLYCPNACSRLLPACTLNSFPQRTHEIKPLLWLQLHSHSQYIAHRTPTPTLDVVE